MRTRRFFLSWLSIGIVSVGAASSAAQSTSAPTQTEHVRAASELNTTDPEVRARAYPHPKIDTTQEWRADTLIRALQKGGFVLYMRHTQTGTVTPECTTSNLTRAGEIDAARVGSALVSLRIGIDKIVTSPICRVRDTARFLGLGDFEMTRDLANSSDALEFDFHAARGSRLAAKPAPGKNTLLVSHMQSGRDFAQAIYLDFGEIVVFRPDGKGGSTPVARIRVDDWAELAKK